MNDGCQIPQIGFGTCLMPSPDTERLVGTALVAGYRHIDTARYYRNEARVGKAVPPVTCPENRCGSPANCPSARTHVRQAIDASVGELGTHPDLYLIHWPQQGHYAQTWRALQEAQADGRLRSVGVSDFHRGHLERILGDGGIRPAVNCADLGIAVQAWSPLGAGAVLRDRTIASVAQDVGRSSAQVILRWHLRRGDPVMPKAGAGPRIRENLASDDFVLSPGDMTRTDRIDRGERGRSGPRPAAA
ncbi:aldo/keto reductase [Streptomyces capillispiralis]|uniref:aldo/keto reductase n=1 Tax=Streptomyces capillispiralis TaxID=68182 RepID=UPI00142F0331|nr:aldo/keto reductase [Streptomyces capillispiralis]